MDHIVAMFNTHEKDAVECYKKNADLFEGQIESAGNAPKILNDRLSVQAHLVIDLTF